MGLNTGENNCATFRVVKFIVPEQNAFVLFLAIYSNLISL